MKNSRAQIEHEGCGYCETEKGETKNCSSAAEKPKGFYWKTGLKFV
jgi:hypothetical protein